MNNFGMYYTACGQGGTTPTKPGEKTKIETDEGVFELMYFSGV